MRYSAAAIILLAAMASAPLLAADDALGQPLRATINDSQFLSSAETSGYWQVAGSGLFNLNSNVSIQVDYLHYQPATTANEAKHPDAIHLRGAYDFSEHWQGFIQVAGGTYIMADPNTAMALKQHQTETMNVGGGVRYHFTNGLYLEGVVQVAESNERAESESIHPLMSVGYQF